ncbi:Ribosome functionion factor 1 [Phytophthora cinnamomi]|uniref:Ribosome functionion factor 1 n=1 Tax=Phytophthora cinnamomi TaxID=4785 RepID=UPI00355A23E0|nr:Ribosome functionion factor 1 [Phytophthora cinnamomi]
MSVSGVEICRRKSCTRLDAEWSCGRPHAMEVRSVTVEDLDEYVAPEDAWATDITASDSDCSSSKVAAVHAPSEFDDAPFAVHSREIRTMWTEPDASDVQVRGRTYMDDQEKVPAGKAMGKLLHVDLWKFETAEERHHVAMREETRPNSVLAYCRETFPESRVFIVNIELPNADNLSLVFYWLLPPAPQNPEEDESAAAFHRLLDRFCDESDDEFRNNRFKLIPNLVDGPWILQTLVPNRPALTGTKLTQHYFRRSNYFELDLDVASSTTAQYVGAMCQSWASYLQMHLYLTIQGENEDELQERVLGGVDVSYLNLELATEFS